MEFEQTFEFENAVSGDEETLEFHSERQQQQQLQPTQSIALQDLSTSQQLKTPEPSSTVDINRSTQTQQFVSHKYLQQLNLNFNQDFSEDVSPQQLITATAAAVAEDGNDYKYLGADAAVAYEFAESTLKQNGLTHENSASPQQPFTRSQVQPQGVMSSVFGEGPLFRNSEGFLLSPQPTISVSNPNSKSPQSRDDSSCLSQREYGLLKKSPQAASSHQLQQQQQNDFPSDFVIQETSLAHSAVSSGESPGSQKLKGSPHYYPKSNNAATRFIVSSSASSQPLVRNIQPQMQQQQQPLLEHSTVTPSTQQSQLICKEHNDFIQLYCADDRSLLCVNCLYLSDRHTRHRVAPLKRCYEAISRENAQFQAEAGEKIIAINRSLNICSSNHQLLSTNTPQIVNIIQREFEDLREALNRQEQTVLYKVTEMLSEKQSECEVIMRDLEYLSACLQEYREYPNEGKDKQNINVAVQVFSIYEMIRNTLKNIDFSFQKIEKKHLLDICDLGGATKTRLLEDIAKIAEILKPIQVRPDKHATINSNRHKPTTATQTTTTTVKSKGSSQKKELSKGTLSSSSSQQQRSLKQIIDQASSIGRSSCDRLIRQTLQFNSDQENEFKICSPKNVLENPRNDEGYDKKKLQFKPDESSTRLQLISHQNSLKLLGNEKQLSQELSTRQHQQQQHLAPQMHYAQAIVSRSTKLNTKKSPQPKLEANQQQHQQQQPQQACQEGQKTPDCVRVRPPSNLGDRPSSAATIVFDKLRPSSPPLNRQAINKKPLQHHSAHTKHTSSSNSNQPLIIYK